MTNTYGITPEQEAVLQKFTCERLSGDPLNFYQIMNFKSEKGQGLVNNLLSNGWTSDAKGSIAYYVIKNPKGHIVMFFSLKCGVLFDPNDVVEFMEYYKDTEIVQLWQDAGYGDESARDYFQELRRKMGRAKYEELVQQLKMYENIKLDKKKEPNQKIVRVNEGHPAIELVEFCANDHTKHCWKEYGMGENRMGETLFWWFIVPKMQEIGRLIGCEYAFLFAADETPDGDLVRYYERLHFRKLTNLGTVKPYYDMRCWFMGKRLRTLSPSLANFTDVRVDSDPKGLDYYKEAYFSHFNQAADAMDNI